MKKCRYDKRKIIGYVLDNNLTTKQTIEVEEHMKKCPSCLKLLFSIDQTNKQLKDVYAKAS